MVGENAVEPRLVRRIRREASVSGSHAHIAGVCTDSGDFMTRVELIVALDRGEIWWAETHGRQVRIRKVMHCDVPGCSLSPYVTTATENTTRNNLENLQEC